MRRRIEYVFGPSRPRTGHSLGVGALALSDELVLGAQSHGTLVSGGRDGRLNAWALGSGGDTVAARVTDIHTNWVNDVVIASKDSVVSCSADTTVKLWQPRSNKVQTVGHHSDYAQRLALRPGGSVASGGLDGKIIGWDLNLCKSSFEFDVGHSVYALASEPSGLLASGSPDGVVRLWDPRQRRPAGKLASHTDSVRSLAVVGDCLLSGSSDATVAVWSLRGNRVLKTLGNFDSSVWSLRAENSGFLAGDRDGNVYSSASATEEPQIVLRRALHDGGVQGLCRDTHTGDLWISTPFEPDLYRFNTRGEIREVIQGHPGLRKHMLLNDKRRALVADTQGIVRMVDLVSAKAIPFERQVATDNVDADLEEILKEVNTMDVLDNWCQVQIKTGQICVTLDPQSVNNTDIYLDDLTEHVGHTEKSPFPTPQTSPRASPLNTPLTSPVSSGFFRQTRSPFMSPAVSRVTSAQSLTEAAHPKSGAKLGTGTGRAKFFTADDDADIEEPADDETADDEQRINLGNWVLRNLLRGMVDRLSEEYAALPEPPAAIKRQETLKPVDNTREQDLKTKKKPRLFSRLLGRSKKRDDAGETDSQAETLTRDDSPAPKSAAEQQENQEPEPESTSFLEAWSRAVANRSLKSADPEAPKPDVMSRRTRLIVTENAAGAGAPTEVFISSVGKLIHSKTECDRIEQVLPGWVGDAVLLGKLNLKPPTKIGFAILPGLRELPELTPAKTRLMAVSMLRARKIMSYTVGQLQQQKILSDEASNYLPEELVTLKCQDQEISALTTLATIRTRIWRKGGDVNMTYTIKKRV